MRGLALVASVLLGVSFAGEPAWSQGSLGSSSSHIVLVADCVDAGWSSGDIGVKCFESVADVVDRIWGGSGLFPTASTPLTVDIGPGAFTGVLECPSGEGHVTFRGAGRDRTVINGVSFGGGLISAAVAATDCDALSFQDLRLVATPAGAYFGIAVAWSGGGSSNWTDVDMQGDDFGWYDAGCAGSSTAAPEGLHYFWGSKVVSPKTGFYSECAEGWFYGGEIDGFSAVTGTFNNNLTAVWVSHRAEFHMFGSAARVVTAGASSGSGNAYGVRVGPTANSFTAPAGHGEFHFHGGAISVNTSNLSSVAATGLLLNDSSGSGTAKAHTLDTAFAVKGGSTSTRISGSGTFESPHLWEARTSPPTAGGSVDGHDIYVETDCNSSGCSGGSDPHLMIYKAGCTSSPWFDTVRNACRN